MRRPSPPPGAEPPQADIASFRIVRSRHRGTVVALCGEFDFGNAARLETLLTQAPRRTDTALTIDLSEVNFLDVAALGVVALIAGRCRESGITVTLDRPRPVVRRLALLCQLNELFEHSQ